MGEPRLQDREYRTLLVIIPVYTERTTVPEIVRRVRAVAVPLDVEVIMVDDGSTDGTNKVLGARVDSTVRFVVHGHNQSNGATIRTGLAYAEGHVVLVQDADADLEYDPGDWPKLLAKMLKHKAYVVYRSRSSELGVKDDLVEEVGLLGRLVTHVPQRITGKFQTQARRDLLR